MYEQFLQWCYFNRDEVVGISNNFLKCPVYNFLRSIGINCIGVGSNYYIPDKAIKFSDERFNILIDLIDESNQRIPLTGQQVFNLALGIK